MSGHRVDHTRGGTDHDDPGAGELSREERAELLAVADETALVQLAETCLARHGDPVVLLAPETGLVMLQVRDPVCDERFHLGEVVVTRAEVELAGAHGWAMRTGTDRVATLAAAVCDAVAGARADLADDVTELCHQTRRRVDLADATEWDELLRTQVAFEELD